MSPSDVTALLALLFSAAIFYMLASRARGKDETLLGYTLAGRKIDSARFGASLAASSTSLATVILFFLATAGQYGFVLFWTGITYVGGQGLFIWYVKNKSVLNRDVRTISDLWYETVRSPAIARFITVITLTSFLIILFIELYIGSIILSQYIRVLSERWAPLISFAALSVLVVGYVRIGGLLGVMQTDRWQLGLMLIAAVALLGHAAISPPGPFESPLSSFFDTNVSASFAVLFCAWILILNFTLPFSQLSSWQRIASAKSGDDIWLGFKTHVGPFFLVWTLPIVAFLLLTLKGWTFGDLTDLISQMKSAGDLSDRVLYPLIMVGFAAALFSTADTALIAIETALADKNTFRDRLETQGPRRLRRIITYASLAILGILTAIFYLAEADLGTWFLPLIYAIFGQLAIVSPLVIYGLLHSDDPPLGISRLGESIIAIGLALSWMVILGAVFVDQAAQSQHWSQLATLAGFVISAVALSIGLRFSKPMPSTEGQTTASVGVGT